MSEITTTSGKPFTLDQHKQLAQLIYLRWGEDLAAATVAWRRLFQNSTTEGQFADLLE